MKSASQNAPEKSCGAKLFDKICKKGPPYSDHSKLVTEVEQLLDAISSGKHRTVSPRRLRAELSARSTEFCDSRMHDAHEFLIRLLEWLHDDLKVATIVAISPSASYPGSSTSSESADIAWRQFQCS